MFGFAPISDAPLSDVTSLPTVTGSASILEKHDTSHAIGLAESIGTASIREFVDRVIANAIAQASHAVIIESHDVIVASAMSYTARPAYVLPAERGLLVLPEPLVESGPVRLPL